MKIGILSLLIAVLIGISAKAEAGRNYYLVGLRHLYKFDIFPDPRAPARQQIEETYAGAVQTAQNQFNTDMASIANEETQDSGNIHQNDRDAVQLNLETDTATAATARDNQLGQMYTQCDWVWDSHPDLKVYQDGPYRVMGVDTNPYGVFTNVYFYQPYPMYVGPCPYGYAWGRPYSYVSFGVVFTSYHTTWVSMGSPLFFGLSFGGAAVQVYAPMRMSMIINQNRWVGGRPAGITVIQRQTMARNWSTQMSRGAIHPPAAAVRYLPSRSGPAGNIGTRPMIRDTGVSKYSGGNRSGTTRTGGSSAGPRGGSSTRGTATGGSRYGRGTSTSGSSSRGTGDSAGGRGSSSTGSRYGSGSGLSTSSRSGSGGSSNSRTKNTGSTTKSSGTTSKYSHSDKDKKGG